MAKKKSARAPQSISFYASLADIQNAITFRGNGDGGRVQFELPRSEVGALLLLQQYGAAKLLHMTIVICTGELAVTSDSDELDQAIDELDDELEIDDG